MTTNGIAHMHDKEWSESPLTQHKGMWGGFDGAPCICICDTRWMVSCQLCLLAALLWWKDSSLPTNRRLGSIPQHILTLEKKKTLYPLLGIEPWFLSCVAYGFVTVWTIPFWLLIVAYLEDFNYRLCLCGLKLHSQMCQSIYVCAPMHTHMQRA